SLHLSPERVARIQLLPEGDVRGNDPAGVLDSGLREPLVFDAMRLVRGLPELLPPLFHVGLVVAFEPAHLAFALEGKDVRRAADISWPVIIRKSVVLPAPLGPITPTMPPGESVSSMPSISRLSP